jgi:uncharacterized damage-inducible protein DinB
MEQPSSPSPTDGSSAAGLFVNYARYSLRTEHWTKLRLAVEALPDSALWWRPDDGSNSVGNLLLHLMGNVRQWIIRGVGGAQGSRDRAAEFAARDGASASELLAGLDAVLAEADRTLATLTPERLMERRQFQGRDLSVLEAVFHVVEHFAMHTGQIIFVTKLTRPGAIHFYEDAGGLARPLWRERVAAPDAGPDRS